MLGIPNLFSWFSRSTEAAESKIAAEGAASAKSAAAGADGKKTELPADKVKTDSDKPAGYDSNTAKQGAKNNKPDVNADLLKMPKVERAVEHSRLTALRSHLISDEHNLTDQVRALEKQIQSGDTSAENVKLLQGLKEKLEETITESKQMTLRITKLEPLIAKDEGLMKRMASSGSFQVITGVGGLATGLVFLPQAFQGMGSSKTAGASAGADAAAAGAATAPASMPVQATPQPTGTFDPYNAQPLYTNASPVA